MDEQTDGWMDNYSQPFPCANPENFPGGVLSLQGCLRHIVFNVNLKKFDSAGEGWGWDSRPPLRSANDLQIYAFMYCIMILVTTLGCRWDVTTNRK